MNPEKRMVKNIAKDIGKRFGVMALICAVAVSMLILPSQPEPAYAAGEKAELNVYYLGDGSAPDFSIAKKNANLTPFTADKIGHIIWIGVAVDKLDRLGKGGVPGGFIRENGIIDMEFGFDYNWKYVEPVVITGGGLPETATDNTFIPEFVKNNLIDGQNTDKKWSKLDYAVGESTMDCGYDHEDLVKAEFNPLLIGNEEWKALQAKIQAKGDIVQPRLKNAGTEQYLAVIPFRLLDIPKEDDPDWNKTAPIKLARSPGRFGFVTDKNGEQYAYWEKDENSNADINLKNMFGFSGDLDFFGGDTPANAAEIGNISITRYFDKPETDPAEEMQENVLTYMDKNAPADPAAYGNYDNANPAVPVKEEAGESTHILDEAYTSPAKEYSPKITNYYADVIHNTKKLELTFDGLDAEPTVKINAAPYAGGIDESDSTAFAGKKKYKIEIDSATMLSNLDPNALAADEGFKNKVEVAVGAGANARTYTIHLRRLLKPEIKLNYGNSPYGEIMKADNIPANKKDEAKAAFLTAGMGRYTSKYHKNYKPDNATYDGRFDIRAWVDVVNLAAPTEDERRNIENPDINMDINDFALFVYNEKSFIDPGFKFISSFGEVIDTASITSGVKRKITVYRMDKPKGIESLYDTKVIKDDLEIPASGARSVITEITPLRTVKPIVRPDVYVMEYEYDFAGEKIKAKRYIIVLQSMGDTDFNRSVNDSDINIITRVVNSPQLLDEVSIKAKRVYMFRALDLDQNEAVNDSDGNIIVRCLTSGEEIRGYYNELI